MYELVIRIFDICLFKKGPQDLPYSGKILKLLALANVVISFLILKMYTDWLKAIFEAFAGIGLITLFCWLSLSVHKKITRFNQTLSALLGTDTIIGFFAIMPTAAMITRQGGLLAVAVMVMFLIWHWAILGHILKNAIGKGLIFSLGLATLYLLASYKIMSLF